ncbi:MAG: glycosyltransferase family 4 protein, partial [Lachnospiraceae bacterium]|nr:glycosyltransferase family 4 protein [Lachnospiraceae bacterium]
SEDYFVSRRVDRSGLFLGAYTYDYRKLREQTALAEKKEIRRVHGIPEKSFVFLFVGKLIPGRRVGDLLRAFEKTEPDELRLIIVGDGEDKNTVDAAAARDERIISVPEVDLDHLYEYLVMADVYVHPGKEPYSCAVMQAAAAGLPVISTDAVGAADDFLKDGQNGKIFTYGDVDAMCKAMLDVYENIDVFRQYAKEAQKYVCENLSTDHAAGQLFEAVSHAAGKRSGR